MLPEIGIEVLMLKLSSLCLLGLVIGCGSSNHEVKKTSVLENAVPNDSNTQLFFVKDNNIAGQFVLLTNGQDVNKRQGYRIWCKNIVKTEPILSSFGFNSVSIGFAMTEFITSESVVLKNSNWKKNPILSCEYEEDVTLYKVSYDKEKNINKYFLSFPDPTNTGKERFYNIGCHEPVIAMGFNLDDAVNIDKKNADKFINKADNFDINCVKGTSLEKSKPDLSPELQKIKVLEQQFKNNLLKIEDTFHAKVNSLKSSFEAKVTHLQINLEKERAMNKELIQALQGKINLNGTDILKVKSDFETKLNSLDSSYKVGIKTNQDLYNELSGGLKSLETQVINNKAKLRTRVSFGGSSYGGWKDKTVAPNYGSCPAGSVMVGLGFKHPSHKNYTHQEKFQIICQKINLSN